MRRPCLWGVTAIYSAALSKPFPLSLFPLSVTSGAGGAQGQGAAAGVQPQAGRLSRRCALGARQLCHGQPQHSLAVTLGGRMACAWSWVSRTAVRDRGGMAVRAQGKMAVCDNTPCAHDCMLGRTVNAAFGGRLLMSRRQPVPMTARRGLPCSVRLVGHSKRLLTPALLSECLLLTQGSQLLSSRHLLDDDFVLLYYASLVFECLSGARVIIPDCSSLSFTAGS